LAGAQDFADKHSMVLKDSSLQVEIIGPQETMNELIAAVEAAGGTYQGHYQSLLQAMVPIDALESLAQQPEVQVIRDPIRPELLGPPLAGTVNTEGLGPANASAWHSAGYTGSGIRVAVVDAGFTNYTSRLGSDLPASVTTYDWTGTGMSGTVHGTACAEVVYDMAPGATMYLHKVGTTVELSQAVNRAITDGVDIISMSLGWTLDGPGDGTGTLASIVANARANGILFVTAAGNEAQVSWSGTFKNDGSGNHLWTSGQNINYFGPGGTTTCYVIPANYPIVVGLHWDDWTSVNQDYDLLLYRWTGSAWSLVAGSFNNQAGSYPTPEEFIGINAPYTACYGVVVSRYSATRNVCLRLVAPKMTHLDEWVTQRSLTFPADAPNAMTVGAVNVNSPYSLEPYSSRGPTFGSGGTCSGGSINPDIAGYANVSTVSYGSGAFNGTSAATPHVGGAAALVLGANPSYSVSQLQSYLENNAVDLGTSGKDNLYGAGRLRLGNPPPLPPPQANSITPNSGANNGSISITNLAGANFKVGATVHLARAGQANINATNIVVVSATKITCNFNLTGAANGLWNVMVTNPDGQSGTLSNGFEVVPGPIAEDYFIYLPIILK
jgi:subtilisin family serine protease